MKPTTILTITLFVCVCFLISCGNVKKDHKSVELEKKTRLKIPPSEYGDMSQEEVQKEIKASESQNENNGDERNF